MISAWQCEDRIPDSPPLSIRIGSFLEAYGTAYSFARFWRQGGGALCLIDGCLTVVSDGNGEDELREFADAVGAESIWSDRLLFPTRQRRFSVWHKPGTGKVGSLPDEVDYRAVYDCLTKSFALPDWEIWYVDVCHRVRHGTAIACSLEQGALCGAVYHGKALITGISVSKHYRRRGVGTRLLRMAESTGYDLYAITESGEAEAFYRASGFSLVSNVYGYEKGIDYETGLF